MTDFMARPIVSVVIPLHNEEANIGRLVDEVDAALDEANVDRFREVVEELGGSTQFILITHNRRTLEASNTIYGITMGDDGVSRVISLRLDGDEMVEVVKDRTTQVAEEEMEVVAM